MMKPAGAAASGVNKQTIFTFSISRGRGVYVSVEAFVELSRSIQSFRGTTQLSCIIARTYGCKGHSPQGRGMLPPCPNS